MSMKHQGSILFCNQSMTCEVFSSVKMAGTVSSVKYSSRTVCTVQNLTFKKERVMVGIKISFLEAMEKLEKTIRVGGTRHKEGATPLKAEYYVTVKTRCSAPLGLG